MDDINESNSVSCEYDESMDDNLAGEEAVDLEQAWKEWIELIVTQSKPQFEIFDGDFQTSLN